MRNKIIAIGYFILLTILSGFSANSNAIEPNIQISGQLTQNQFNQTSEIEALFRANIDLGNAITYAKVPRGLVVSTDSSLFFEEGKDEIKENAKQILDKFGAIIKYLDKPCVIEGSSKSTSIKSPYYNTNWEMSIVRAEKIAQYLIKTTQINPQKIRAVGFGDMIPFVDNVNYKNEKTQRIDFVILNYEESDFNIQ